MGEEQVLVDKGIVAGLEAKVAFKDGKLVAELDLSPAVVLELVKKAIPGQIDDVLIDGLEKALGLK